MGSETEMGTVSERQVGIRPPVKLNALRARKSVLVPVGRNIPQRDDVSPVDQSPADLDIGAGHASEMHSGDMPSDHLLDRGAQIHRVRAEIPPHVWLLGKSMYRADHGQPTRLLAAEQQAVAIGHDLVIAQPGSADPGLQEGSDQTRAWTCALLGDMLQEVEQNVLPHRGAVKRGLAGVI